MNIDNSDIGNPEKHSLPNGKGLAIDIAIFILIFRQYLSTFLLKSR